MNEHEKARRESIIRIHGIITKQANDARARGDAREAAYQAGQAAYYETLWCDQFGEPFPLEMQCLSVFDGLKKLLSLKTE